MKSKIMTAIISFFKELLTLSFSPAYATLQMRYIKYHKNKLSPDFSLYAFIQNSILEFEKVNTKLSLEGNNNHSDDFTRMITLFREEPDLAISYFNKNEFLRKDCKQMLNEFNKKKDLSLLSAYNFEENTNSKQIKPNQQVSSDTLTYKEKLSKDSNKLEIFDIEKIKEKLKNIDNDIIVKRACAYLIAENILKDFDHLNQKMRAIKCGQWLFNDENYFESTGHFMKPTYQKGSESADSVKSNLEFLIPIFKNLGLNKLSEEVKSDLDFNN
jgi:hypothetical protein